MTTQPALKFFVNLPVRDLKASKAFFAKLGFSFNVAFTDDTAACMNVNDGSFVMLLTQEKFKMFTPREIVDTRTHVQGLFGVFVSTSRELDVMVDAAVAAGGVEAEEPTDYGFMRQRSFYDLDGHGWVVSYMDPNHSPK